MISTFYAVTFLYFLYCAYAGFYGSNSYEKIRADKSNYRIAEVNGEKEVQLKRFYFYAPFIQSKWETIFLTFGDLTVKEHLKLTLEEKIDNNVDYYTNGSKKTTKVIKTF